MVRDCVPFLILSGVVLIGFSIGLFAMFQDIIEASNSNDQEDNDGGDDNETFKKINASFKTPWRAMLTMFCAMVGTFDVEVWTESKLELV